MAIAALAVNGDGDTSDWVGDSTDVDDGSSFDDADDGTTDIFGGTSGDKSDFNLEDLSVGSVTVNSVEHNMRSRRRGNIGTATLIPYFRLSGIESAGTERSVQTQWVNFSEVIGRPGGGGWSDADVDALLIGAEVTSSKDPKVTIYFVDVDYTVAGAAGHDYLAAYIRRRADQYRVRT